VWTGSTYFTDDAWTRQENNIIIIVASGPLAAAYRVDFDQMWTGGTITNARRGDAGTAPAGGGQVGWDFCPGDGMAINAALAYRIDPGRSLLRRRRTCSTARRERGRHDYMFYPSGWSSRT
jgi:hypothetical protein